MKVLGCDQSLTATALCVVDDGKLAHSETIKHPDSVKGFERVDRIIQKVRSTLTERQIDVFVMEDYSVGPSARTMIGLIELGGCIKLEAYRMGYKTGRDPVLRGEKVFMLQAAASMKKFMLGQGNVTKDTSYLLKVNQRLNIAFDDDNQADAYMHASMAGLVYNVTRGKVPISNLTVTQQEALISRGVNRTKNLSMTKAMKLPDERKLELAGY